jgi:hypothetical protein
MLLHLLRTLEAAPAACIELLHLGCNAGWTRPTPAQARSARDDEFSTPTPQTAPSPGGERLPLGTDPRNARDAVVIYDSDGHLSGDMQSLGRARRMGPRQAPRLPPLLLRYPEEVVALRRASHLLRLPLHSAACLRVAKGVRCRG